MLDTAAPAQIAGSVLGSPARWRVVLCGSWRRMCPALELSAAWPGPAAPRGRVVPCSVHCMGPARHSPTGCSPRLLLTAQRLLHGIDELTPLGRGGCHCQQATESAQLRGGREAGVGACCE